VPPELCPTPWKMRWESRRSAVNHARRAKAAQKAGQVRPYRCVCGCWHVSSMSKRTAKLVKRGRVA